MPLSDLYFHFGGKSNSCFLYFGTTMLKDKKFGFRNLPLCYILIILFSCCSLAYCGLKFIDLISCLDLLILTEVFDILGVSPCGHYFFSSYLNSFIKV